MASPNVASPYVFQPHKPKIALIEAKRQPRAKYRAITRRMQRRLKIVTRWTMAA